MVFLAFMFQKTPNTSEINKNVVNKIVITKDDISKINANDVGDVLSKIAGIDVFQSGQKGQQTSVFMRLRIKSYPCSVKWYSNQ